MMTKPAILSGPLPAKLGNAVSDAIHAGLRAGMEVDEAACIAIAVACDYARGEYGDAYLEEIVTLVRAQRGRAAPFVPPPPEGAST